MSSSRQPEDLLSLSLSLSQPLPTDHYTPASLGLNKIMAGLELDSRPASQLGRIGTPGTSGDDGKSGSGSGIASNSSGSDPFERKKVKKKKKKKAGECLLPEIIPEDDTPTSLAYPQPISPIKTSLLKSEIIPIPTSSTSTARPQSPDIHARSERWPHRTMSDAENIEKESIIVETWDGRWAEERTGDFDRFDATRIGSLPSENDMPTISSEAVRSDSLIQTSPRRATPMQVRRPAPTLLDEFPTLMNIPNLIPSGIGISTVPLPSLRDVRAAGRATAKAGIALVETVKDEYLTRIMGEGAAAHSSERDKVRGNTQRNSRSGRSENPRSPRRPSRRDSRRRGQGLDIPSESDNDIEGATPSISGLTDDASEDNLDGDSDDEVLIDLDDAEGLTETWKGFKGQPSEAALGHGWTKWRSCKWEYVSFPDGEERRFLVNINPTPQTALQVIDCGASNSANTYTSLASTFNMLHPETIDLANSTILQTSPAEILHIPRQYSRALRQVSDDQVAQDSQGVFNCATLEVMAGVDPGMDVLDEENHLEEVLVDCAVWRTGTPISGHHALKWLLLTQKRSAKSYMEHGTGCATEEYPVYLNVLDVNSQRVESKVLMGAARGGQILSSPQSVVITLAGNAPSIHFLSATTLKPTLRPINSHIGLNSRTGLPVISLSGRLFAYTTLDARPRQPVPRGAEDMKLGTMVTSTSSQAFHSRQQQSDMGSHNGSSAKPASNPSYTIEGPPSMQAMVLNTAAGLGSEMAKGVWTGLKGLSTAAINGASKSETLSKGAPAFSSFTQKYVPSRSNGGVGGKANTHTGASSNGFHGPAGGRLPPTQSRFSSGSWIKVLDLGSDQSRKLRKTHPEESKKKGKDKLSKPITIAHFALPATEVIAMPHPTVLPPGVDALCFAPGGTSLALGTTDGRSSFTVEIRPPTMGILTTPSCSDEPTGAVWLRYELRRGVTPAIVEKIEWSACGGWIGVGTRRTIHVFVVHPLGGRVSALQIKSSRPRNLDYIPALSTKISPVLRIRRPRGIMKRSIKASAPPSPSVSGNVSDTSCTLRKSAYRVPARLFCFGPSMSASTSHATERHKTSSGVLRTVDVFDPLKNILRSEAIYALRDNAILVQSGTQEGTPSKEEELKLASLTFRAWKISSKPYQLQVSGQTSDTPSLAAKMSKTSVAQAEIYTHSTSTQVVPRPIYRENWLIFESIDGAPTGARTPYRFRMTVDPSCPPGREDSVREFDRPLAKAIQSQLDLEQSTFVIPALPNGAGKEPSRWQSSIGAFAHAKDIVRMRRKDSKSTSTSVTTGTAGTTPASYDDHLVIDGATRIIFEGNEGGINDPDDMTTGSTSGDTRDDEWDDDLVTGAMDDEWHGAVPGHPHTKGTNKPRENDSSKKHNKY